MLVAVEGGPGQGHIPLGSSDPAPCPAPVNASVLIFTFPSQPHIRRSEVLLRVIERHPTAQETPPPPATPRSLSRGIPPLPGLVLEAEKPRSQVTTDEGSGEKAGALGGKGSPLGAPRVR